MPTSGRPITVSGASLANRQWQASASSKPPPAQAPWIAQTTGTLKSASKENNACPSRATAAAAAVSLIWPSHFRSAPAMKIFSFALMMTTDLTGAADNADSASRSAACVAGLNTLARPAGLSKVIQPMPSASTDWVTEGGRLMVSLGLPADNSGPRVLTTPNPG